MAKACDVMLMDVMSSSKAVAAALEPGDTLRQLQEKLVLARLDEMKGWVGSGRWQEFLRRESAQDLKDLAGWLRTDCRMDIHDIIQDESQRRHLEKEDAF